MKKNIIQALKMAVKYSFIGFVAQTLVVSIMLALPAEGQNLKDVKVNVNAVNVTLEQAFKLVEQKTSFKFIYDVNEIPLNEKITLNMTEESLYDILELLAKDYGITFNRINDQIVVRKSDGKTENLVTAAETGSIKGKVTDASTKEGLIGASVQLKGTNLGSYSDSKGYFEINNVKPGKYSCVVTYVGYSSSTKTIEVSADKRTEVNFALGESVINLNETVVTGTLSERTIRESANPISIITPKELENRNLSSLTSVLESVPGIMFSAATDNEGDGSRAGSTKYTGLNIRGYMPNGAGYTSGSTKFLVDGVEVFDYSILNTLDPNQIEKIEVIRGPMATTLYGAGSASGIIHIITKRGAGEVKVSLKTMLESRESYLYDNNPINAQSSLNIKGGQGSIGYNVGLNYQYYPSSRWGEYSSGIDEKDFTYNAAVNVMVSDIKVDLRFEQATNVAGLNYIPTWAKVAEHEGLPNPKKIIIKSSVLVSEQRYDDKITTASLNIKQIINENLYHNLSVGSSGKMSYRNALEPYSQTTGTYQNLVYDFSNKNVKYYLNYNFSPIDNFKIDFTGGFDYLDQHARVSVDFLETVYGDNVTQPQSTTAGFKGYNTNYRTKTTGFFGEAVFGFWNDLFVTTGIRQEENTSWGDGFWSMPRAGITYVYKFSDNLTVKPRFSWGRSSQGVSPQFKLGFVTSPTIITLPNPDLRPQTQSGCEIGADLFITDNFSVGITYYNQKVKDLINAEQWLDSLIQYTKYVNVLEVPNEGLEVSSKIIWNPFQVDLSATFNSSKYGPGNSTDPNSIYYEGKRVGNIPLSTIFAKVSYKIPDIFNADGKGGKLSVEYKYTGSTVGADYLTYYSTYLNTGHYPSPFPYAEFSGYSKLAARLDYSLFNNLTLFIDVKNLMNSQVLIANGPIIGRVITFGFNLTN